MLLIWIVVDTAQTHLWKWAPSLQNIRTVFESADHDGNDPAEAYNFKIISDEKKTPV